MKLTQAVLLLCAAAMLAPAQSFNKAAANGANPSVAATLTYTPASGKAAILESICWGAQSSGAGSGIVAGSSVAISITVGGTAIAVFPTPHQATSGPGQFTVPIFCTPPTFKVTGGVDQVIVVAFNTGITNAVQNISVAGREE